MPQKNEQDITVLIALRQSKQLDKQIGFANKIDQSASSDKLYHQLYIYGTDSKNFIYSSDTRLERHSASSLQTGVSIWA